jgi:peptide/nickel transport system permease protein
MNRWWGSAVIVTLVAAARYLRAADPRRLVLSLDLARPDAAHPLGCGDGGVDLLALASESLLRGWWLAAWVAALALAAGTLLGTAAGLAGGRWARATARVCDGVQAFPSFVLALAVLAAIRHPQRWHVGLVLLATAWAPFCRLALAELRVVRSLPFVEAARALGATPVLLVHALPAAWPTARAQLGTSAAALLVSDAALGFLGLGPADGVGLGALIDMGVGTSLRAPHVLLVGTATLCFGTLLLLWLADPSALRDAGRGREDA